MGFCSSNGKKGSLDRPCQAHKEYNLEDESARKELGLFYEDPSHPPKISDRYVLYSNGKRAVVELKSSSTLYKAIQQLEATVNLL